MAIIHTPRTLISIGRGILRRRRRLASANSNIDSADKAVASNFVGFVPAQTSVGSNVEGNASSIDSNTNNTINAHVYNCRANWFWDLDYIGHMNNASYLTHAEYARWEWTAETGALQAMYRTRTNFIVTSTAVRFRKEIAALRNAFEIHSLLRGIDEKHFWISQTFRNPSDERILAQVMVQAVAVRNRTIVPPRTMLDAMGLPGEIVDSLLLPSNSDEQERSDFVDGENAMDVLARFMDLDEAFRHEATADDQWLLTRK
ncbi:unnamed protein product [Pseudo-nitzschia multistriata]|uniref:Thioesterase domain-containing protein n=1 Tax=Pseudo-nitzschia multistriata TaxID=183589 RepID=A0A448ZM46_9STRA|nr:unnamed protein product [Pseudo-nitzschia multistriata]